MLEAEVVICARQKRYTFYGRGVILDSSTLGQRLCQNAGMNVNSYFKESSRYFHNLCFGIFLDMGVGGEQGCTLLGIVCLFCRIPGLESPIWYFCDFSFFMFHIVSHFRKEYIIRAVFRFLKFIIDSYTTDDWCLCAMKLLSMVFYY